jgi:hypothetical protein
VFAIFEDMLSKTYRNFLSRLSALIVLYTDSIDKNCPPDEKKLVDQAGQKSQLEVSAVFEDMLSKTCSSFLFRLTALQYTDF